MEMLSANEVLYLLKSNVLDIYRSKALKWVLSCAKHKDFNTCWKLTVSTTSFNPHNNSTRSGPLLSLFLDQVENKVYVNTFRTLYSDLNVKKVNKALEENKKGWNIKLELSFEGSCSDAEDFGLDSRGISELLNIFKPGNGVM